MDVISFGLIGLGRHGSRYARHLMADVPGARLVAVCRRNREGGEAFARNHGLTFYAEPQALLADPRVEAVAIVVPPALHRDLCLAAIGHRLPFVVEKPMAPSLAEAQEILGAAEQAGVRGTVAHTLRFDSVVRSLKAEIPHFGGIDVLTIRQRMEGFSRTWIDDPDSGGILRHIGVHALDLIRFLREEEVSSLYCEITRISSIHTEDCFAAVLRLHGDGAVALVNAVGGTSGREGRIEVIGDGGLLVADYTRGSLKRRKGTRSITLPVSPAVPTVRECLAAFVAWLAGGPAPPVSLQDGLRAVELVDACHRSAATHTLVRLG
ncbi:MAG: Gfo/Idh/MocA family protein [Candidatus Methylomirabilia bacterium]